MNEGFDWYTAVRLDTARETAISCFIMDQPVSEFNEFKTRLKSPKNRFQLSVGLNLEKLDTILSGINHNWAAV